MLTKQKNAALTLHLNIGQPDVLSPKVAMDKVREAKLELLPYGSSQGPFSYRKKLCDYYKKNHISIEPNDIIVTTGASEALSFTLNVICDAGDEIIIPEPFYANYNGFAASSSVVVVPVVSVFDDKFELPSIEKMEEKPKKPSSKFAIIAIYIFKPTIFIFNINSIKIQKYST